MKKLIKGGCPSKKGFTLIELLIVVAIIGLLATLAILSLTSAQAKARDTKRVADMKSLQNAVEMYYNDNSAYPQPTTWANFGTAMTAGTTAYLNALPAPPGGGVSGDQYTYKYSASGAGYCVLTTLEKDNQILDQSETTDECGLTVAGEVSSGTVQDSCAVGSFHLCLGN